MIKDNNFFRTEGVPLTKEEIRAVSIGKLQLKNDDIVVDIGCGSGGMTVELAKRCKFVYAIDISDDAIFTTKKNLDRFNIKNCKVIKGNARHVLPKLKFNKVFIGGTKNIYEILSILVERDISHIVANTIVLENSVKIIEFFNNYNSKINNNGMYNNGDINIYNTALYNIEVVNISVSYGKKISSGYMMIAKNPIIILTITTTEDVC